MSPSQVDIGSEQAQAKIEAAIAGCTAVVACVGNRFSVYGL